MNKGNHEKEPRAQSKTIQLHGKTLQLPFFIYLISLLDVCNCPHTHSSKRRMNNYVKAVNGSYENAHMGKQLPLHPKKKKKRKKESMSS